MSLGSSGWVLVLGLALYFMGKHTWLSPRFNSKITLLRNTLQVRTQIVQILCPRQPLQRARAPEIVQKNELEFKHGKLWKMAADLFDCAGLRLGSSSCKLQALA